MTPLEFLKAWWWKHGTAVLWAILVASLSAGTIGGACLLGEVKGEAR